MENKSYSAAARPSADQSKGKKLSKYHIFGDIPEGDIDLNDDNDDSDDKGK